MSNPTNYLRGNPWLGSLYAVFGANGDKELCVKMTNIGLIYTLVVGLYSVFKPSPYGRYSSVMYGPTINAKLGWVVQECMSFIIPVILVLTTPGIQLNNFANIVVLGLFMLHYFQRSFIYPLTISSKAKPAPVAVVLAAIMFTTYNGFLQGHYLVNVVPVEDSFYLFTGTVIFLSGMAINVTHDQMLISLRKTSVKDDSLDSSRKNTQKYKIPHGGLFELISGANYFGEIIEWIGLAVITREYPQIIFATFSAVFLGIRAVHHHRFYKETFGTAYPKTRKAIIPFIF